MTVPGQQITIKPTKCETNKAADELDKSPSRQTSCKSGDHFGGFAVHNVVRSYGVVCRWKVAANESSTTTSQRPSIPSVAQSATVWLKWVL